MWGGNLTLFAVFYGYLVRFLHQSGKWKGMLNSSSKAVEWGDTLMQWLSLLVDFGQVTPTLGLKLTGLLLMNALLPVCWVYDCALSLEHQCRPTLVLSSLTKETDCRPSLL